MDSTITRAEHEEFRRRLDEHNKRQDKRIEILEKGQQQVQELALSVQKLASNMEIMCEEIKAHRNRLDGVEFRDGETWRKLQYYALTAIASLIIGAIGARLG